MFQAAPVSGKIRVCQALKNARLLKKQSLTDIASELKINKIYLKALEDGEYNKLPSGIYAFNYLREYCYYLDLNYRQLLEDFKLEKELFSEKKISVYETQVVDRKYFLSFPKILRSVGIALTALVCLSYLAYLIANIYLPPKLNIINPKENIATVNKKIIISGISEKESEVFVNDALISINSDGYFEYPINLRQGVNTITIVAQKKNKKKQIEIREILYKDSQNPISMGR